MCAHSLYPLPLLCMNANWTSRHTYWTLWGKLLSLPFWLFLHLLHLYLMAYLTALLWGYRGQCARIPSGSCARFYYMRVSDECGGELEKSAHFATFWISLCLTWSLGENSIHSVTMFVLGGRGWLIRSLQEVWYYHYFILTLARACGLK